KSHKFSWISANVEKLKSRVGFDKFLEYRVCSNSNSMAVALFQYFFQFSKMVECLLCFLSPLSRYSMVERAGALEKLLVTVLIDEEAHLSDYSLQPAAARFLPELLSG